MTRGRILPWLLVGLYWFLLATLAGEIKFDHLIFGGAVLLLSHLGARGRQVLLFLLPFILTGVVYDSQRYWGGFRGTPDIAGPYLLERGLFGIPSPDGPLTPNEWLGLHLHPVLDLIAGGAYLTFIGVFMLVALLLTRRIYTGAVESPDAGVGLISAGSPNAAGAGWSPDRRFWTAQSLVWCFLLVNLVGYATWYLYPAAPPWYVEAHGLETVLLDVPGNLGRSGRFDALLGTSFFTRMYGYEANAFGAIPSLHISYPTLSVFFAFRLGAFRTLTSVFLAIMCFAAVYLNHHYLIDVLLGVAYGLIAGVMTVAVAEWAITSSSFRPSVRPKAA